MRDYMQVYRVPGAVAFLLAALSAMPVLKLGEVQIIELVQVLLLGMLVLAGAYAGAPIPATGFWKEYGPRYLLFLAMCLALGILSLRLTFYAPPGTSFLKQPIVISLARIGELFLAMYCTLALADTFRRDRKLLRRTLDTYWIIGGISAAFSMASAVLMKTTGVMLYFVYGDDARVRGFFNEAGPYGIFLVSVLIVLLLRAHYFPVGLLWLRRAVFALTLLALYQSASKAGFLTVIGVCGLVGLFAANVRQRLVVIVGLVAVAALTWTTLGPQFIDYWTDYSGFEDAVAARSDDPSLIMGRIVATFIVPRMIAEHPLAGIGIGNYSLMRNDPAYLQGLPAVADWDLPGLGLVGSCAELGIPLTVALLALLFRPLRQTRGVRAPAIVLTAAAFQPIAAFAGVNLNFFYPWLMAAATLALLPDGRDIPKFAD